MEEVQQGAQTAAVVLVHKAAEAVHIAVADMASRGRRTRGSGVLLLVLTRLSLGRS